MKAAALRKSAEVLELTNAANAGPICEQLKVERKEVCQSLSAIGTLVQTEVGELEGGKSSDVRKVEWQPREWMQDPLHYIDHAFECLLGAAYGRCHACGEALGTGRLMVDPAVALCLVCQRNR